jgi:predicted acyl esterase
MDLTSISKFFAPGHRIGLFVMSSSFPELEPMPVKSRNTICHDSKRASWLELPVIPATR